MLSTRTGVPRSSDVPSPSCPKLLLPQAHTAPSLVRASEKKAAAEMSVTPVRLDTLTGLGVGVKRPSPSSPE